MLASRLPAVEHRDRQRHLAPRRDRRGGDRRDEPLRRARHVWAALLGTLVIGSVSNGLDLLNVGAGQRFVITGLVLLAAVTVDSLSRRGREQSGRA